MLLIVGSLGDVNPAPPGGNGTIQRTGLEGKFCANAGIAQKAKRAAKVSENQRQTFFIIKPSQSNFRHESFTKVCRLARGKINSARGV